MRMINDFVFSGTELNKLFQTQVGSSNHQALTAMQVRNKSGISTCVGQQSRASSPILPVLRGIAPRGGFVICDNPVLFSLTGGRRPQWRYCAGRGRQCEILPTNYTTAH